MQQLLGLHRMNSGSEETTRNQVSLSQGRPGVVAMGRVEAADTYPHASLRRYLSTTSSTQKEDEGFDSGKRMIVQYLDAGSGSILLIHECYHRHNLVGSWGVLSSRRSLCGERGAAVWREGGAGGEVSRKISSTNVDTVHVCARCPVHAGFFTSRVVPCSGDALTAGRTSVLFDAVVEVHIRNPFFLPISGTRIEQSVFCRT